MTTDKTRQAGTRQAQQARQTRQESKAQIVAQTSAREVQEQVSNITNVPLGRPLDPSKGFSFDPNSRPRELPMPGDAPGGVPERSQQSLVTMGDEMEDPAQPNLQDDHDDIFPQAAAPSQRQAPKIQQADPVQEHPILTKLRQDLGIDQINPADVEVGGHRWTMTILAPGDVALAARLTDSMSDTPTERQIVYQGAITSHSIVAIDGVPVYQVFGIVPMPGIVVTDHFRPPKSIRFLAAAKLFDFINDGSKTQLNDKLYDAYLDKVDIHGTVQSYLDDPNNQKVQFRCPETGCGHEVRIIPRKVLGTNDVHLPFCQQHGCPMPMVKEAAGPLR